MKASFAKKRLRVLACNRGYTDQQVDAYIKEAEHQDGTAFWKSFKNESEALEDFMRYWNNYA